MHKSLDEFEFQQISAVLGRIWPKFELVRDIMVVLITCKNKEDPIKNEGA